MSPHTASPVHFKDLCTRHSRACRLKCFSKNTLLRHTQSQKLFLEFLGEDSIVESLSAAHLEDFILYLLDRNLKASTVNVHLRTLKALWRWGTEIANPPLLEKNPFRGVSLLKEGAQLPGFFTPYEFLRLLHAADQEVNPLLCARNKAILLMLYDTGIRAEELCVLQIMDYQDNTNTSVWKPNLAIHDPKWIPAGTLTIQGKGGKERQVPISPSTVQHLNNWRVLLNETVENLKIQKKGEKSITLPTWLFCSSQLGQMTRGRLRVICAKLGERVNLHCHPHKLRHSFAMFYLNSSPKEKESLQKILGHSSSRMTDHYARLLNRTNTRSHASNSPVAKLMGDARSREEALAIL